jgi:nucleoside-diphosphate-sugar epimerase
MPKKALVTGASGFLGSIISDSLRNSYQVKTFGRKKENNFSIDLSKENLTFETNETFDTIIHAAGKAHSVPKTQSETQDFYKTNFEGTKKLCNVLSSSNRLPKSFIFISSVSVYGVDEGEFISEEHSLNGTSPYAQSKILAEEWLLQWANEYNVILSILRLPLLAGPNPPGNLKTMIKGIQNSYYFNIAGGKAKKSMVLAEDVAKIIPVVANIGGVYNLTDQYHPSFLELSQVIAQQLRKPNPLNVPLWMATLMAMTGDLLGLQAPINSKKLLKITSDLTFDDSKAQHLLGWKPTSVLSGFKIV